MKIYKRGFITVVSLITITSGAMAYITAQENPPANRPALQTSDVVTLDTKLVQDKVLQGSDGQIGVSLTLRGIEMKDAAVQEIQPVDLVVVLDRSGSMEGQKIHDARQAVVGLMERLSPKDRMAVITYSNNVDTLFPLINMNNANRENLSHRVRHIRPGGGTNLGSGLQQGLSAMLAGRSAERQRKMILISDGLANQGITDPNALGRMAANGAEYNLSVSSVGVGYDFNEILMTTIADHGLGNYHFLENPQAFAKVFEKEFEASRIVVASGLEIRIPLPKGVQLVDAGGFPIQLDGNVAVVRPGDLLSGQKRKFFFTFQLPTAEESSFSINNIHTRFIHDGENMVATSEDVLTINCVKDEKEVVASIDAAVWSEQVVKEEYNKLKDKVATAIRRGEKSKAFETIQEYEEKNRTLNGAIGSSAVRQNLDEDVQLLRKEVDETFAGAPAAVAQKKKQQAKTLQYESYRARRDKQ